MTVDAATFPPLAIAHRGFSAAYPENTKHAFDAALKLPIDGMELDVQTTLDGIPMVFHDITTKRLGAGKTRLRDLTYEQTENLDFGQWFSPSFKGTTGITLRQTLENYGRRCLLLLEIKCDRRGKFMARDKFSMDLTIQCIRELGLEQQVFILSFNDELLRYGHQKAPDLRFVLNTKHAAVLANHDHLFAYSIAIGALTPAFVEFVHQDQKPVFVYTCNSQRQLRKAWKCRVNAIMSDDPSNLLEFIKNQSEETGPR